VVERGQEFLGVRQERWLVAAGVRHRADALLQEVKGAQA
jgi:hypothetical protein